jgi:hypothetical protein
MNRARIILFIAWIFLVAAITAWNLLALVPGDSQLAFEANLRHAGLMALLSFPLGPLLWLILIFALSLDFEMARSEIVFNSVLCFAVGLFQWFYLVPRTLRWIKSKRAAIDQ